MGKKKHYKVGEDIEFNFAGTIEKGKVEEILVKGTDPEYRVWDGSYTYIVKVKHLI